MIFIIIILHHWNNATVCIRVETTDHHLHYRCVLHRDLAKLILPDLDVNCELDRNSCVGLWTLLTTNHLSDSTRS